MLSHKKSLNILKRTNALLEGHFVLSSGLHSPIYIQCAKLLSFPHLSKKICVDLSRKIKIHDTKGFHLFISFGYRHIITEKIIKKIKGPLINLHLSYLPYNRGAHPNFWSFVDNTPSGVSIVEIDKGIDTGPVIYKKKIKFDLKKKQKPYF